MPAWRRPTSRSRADLGVRLPLLPRPRRGRVRRWLLPGMLFGLAMAAKASALTFVPLVMLAFEIPRCTRPGRSPRRRASAASATSGGRRPVFAGTLEDPCDRAPFVVWTIAAATGSRSRSFVKVADNLPDEQLRTTTVRWPTDAEPRSSRTRARHSPIRSSTTCAATRVHARRTGTTRSIWYYFPVAADDQADAACCVLARAARPRPR